MQVATIGMQSNVAAALDRDPAFAANVDRLAVMGGMFAPVRFFGEELPPSLDHNLNVDPQASLRALNAGFNMLITPIDVTMTAWLMQEQLDRLRAGGRMVGLISHVGALRERVRHGIEVQPGNGGSHLRVGELHQRRVRLARFRADNQGTAIGPSGPAAA